VFAAVATVDQFAAIPAERNASDVCRKLRRSIAMVD
jgi:hypothetical protein